MVKSSSTLILFILISYLSGCSVGKTTPAIDIYTLTPSQNLDYAQPEVMAKGSLIIALSPIHGSHGLMGPEIIYTDTEHGYNSYAYSRWSDSPTKLLALLFQQSLQQNHQFAAVIPSESSSAADLLLEGTLYDFSHQLKNDGMSYGAVTIRFYLIDNKTKTMLATEAFSSEVPANSRNAKGATAALNQASNDVADQLYIWLDQQINLLSEK